MEQDIAVPQRHTTTGPHKNFSDTFNSRGYSTSSLSCKKAQTPWFRVLFLTFKHAQGPPLFLPQTASTVLLFLKLFTGTRCGCWCSPGCVTTHMVGEGGGCGVPFHGDDGGSERENNGNKFKSGVAAGVWFVASIGRSDFKMMITPTKNSTRALYCCHWCAIWGGY